MWMPLSFNGWPPWMLEFGVGQRVLIGIGMIWGYINLRFAKQERLQDIIEDKNKKK